MAELKRCTDRYAHIAITVPRIKWDDWMALHDHSETKALKALRLTIADAITARMVSLHMEAMERFYEEPSDEIPASARAKPVHPAAEA